MGKRRNHHNWLFPLLYLAPPAYLNQFPSSRISWIPSIPSQWYMIGPPTGDISFRILHPWKLRNVPLKKREPFQKEHSFVFRGRSIYQDPTTKDPRVLKKKKEAEIPSYRIFHFHISKIYVANQKQLKASKLHFLKQRPESMVEAPKSFPNNTNIRFCCHTGYLPRLLETPVLPCWRWYTSLWLVSNHGPPSYPWLQSFWQRKWECIIISDLKHTMKTSFLELLIINRY